MSEPIYDSDLSQPIPDEPSIPRDAASLVLVRQNKGHWQVLMGQRDAHHPVMPGKWVFPGGKVEPYDHRGPVSGALPAHTRLLLSRFSPTPPQSKVEALPLAAMRELSEETGLIAGTPHLTAGLVPSAFDAFRKARRAPDLAHVHFIARAITPPGRPKRFDARFFLADAGTLGLMSPRATPHRPDRDAEFAHIAWHDLDTALELDLPGVTRFVLDEAADILATRTPRWPLLLTARDGEHFVQRLTLLRERPLAFG